MIRYISLPKLYLLILFCFNCREKIVTKTFNAMAPLHVMHYLDPKIEDDNDWRLFRRQLVECHRMGIDAITVDVWWGSVEKDGNNIFDWEYYHKIFTEIISQDLDIIPILSFHSFDPGPESAFRAPVPDWVWSYLAHESGLKIIDLKYVSEDLGENENPLFSNEFVSLWVDDWVMPQYIEFMEEFLNEFQNYLHNFQEINISCGPTGELRYPSYNSHDGGKYPNRGRMQCYSDPAIQDYVDWLKKVNEGDGVTINSPSLVLPNDFKLAIKNEDYFNNNIKTLFQWYNLSLMNHGNRMLNACLKIFPKSIPIGFKIPGIHWLIADPKMPRISEMTCGLIDGSKLDGELAYYNSLAIVLKDLPLERIILHFTCLELDNAGPNLDSIKHYSRAKDLVYDVSSAAAKLGVNIKGENALSKSLKNQAAWLRIRSALLNGDYSGITILRMNDVTFGNSLGNKEYGKIINEFDK